MINEELLTAIKQLCTDIKLTTSEKYPSLAKYKTMEFQVGRKYCKIIEQNSSNTRNVGQISERVWGFVNIVEGKFKVGDVLMAAGWKAPATNKARGNLLDGYPVTASNMHGPHYL